MHDQELILRSPANAGKDDHASEPLSVVMGSKEQPKSRMGLGVVVFLIAAAVIGAIWLLAMTSMQHLPGFWGVSIASVLFWLSVTQGMIAIGALLRLSHASWRFPLTRLLDMASLFGFWLILLIPLLAKMRAMIYSPMSTGNMGHVISDKVLMTQNHTHVAVAGADKLWRAPASSSFLIDCIFVVTAYLAGYFLLRLGALPDFAALRDRAPANRRKAFAGSARGAFGILGGGGFIGAQRQWQILRLGEGFIMIGAVMAFFASQTVMGWDFQLAAGAVWDSSIFPFQVNLSALMAGTAMLTLIMTVVRGRMRGGDVIGDKQYDALGKLMIALGLLFFYFRWCDYITAWYGHTPEEWNVQLERTTHFPVLFTLMVIGCIILPIFANIFRQVRTSRFLMCLLSLFALLGLWCQKFLDTVPAFGYVPGAMDPAAAWAGVLALVTVGALFLLTYFWAIPRYSTMSWWSMSKWRTRSSVRPLGNASVTVMVEDPPVWEN